MERGYNMDFISAKTIITRTKNDFWFGKDYNMNLYKGCSHGCIYCDSRSDCYGIDNFDTVRVKANAIDIIRTELKSKVKKGVIGTGAMSDPYNPFEKHYELTRQALELINIYKFGVAIDTKSSLITRDIDVLKGINAHSPVIVKITITTCDDELCKIIEPNVALSSERFSAIKQLADNGIYTGIILTPVLPFLEDTSDNIKGIVHLAHENGAKFIYAGLGVTLRQNQREWYYKKLNEHFPGLREKYINHYGYSYQCQSPRYDELLQLFKLECKKYDLIYRMEEIIKAYKYKNIYDQLSMF